MNLLQNLMNFFKFIYINISTPCTFFSTVIVMLYMLYNIYLYYMYNTYHIDVISGVQSYCFVLPEIFIINFNV